MSTTDPADLPPVDIPGMSTDVDHEQLLEDMRIACDESVEAIDADLRPFIGLAALELATVTALPTDIADMLTTLSTDDRYLQLSRGDARALRLACLGLLTALEG